MHTIPQILRVNTPDGPMEIESAVDIVKIMLRYRREGMSQALIRLLYNLGWPQRSLLVNLIDEAFGLLADGYVGDINDSNEN